MGLSFKYLYHQDLKSDNKRLLFYLRFLQAGGSPEKVVEMLSDNYTAVAQTVNLLAEWLIQAGIYSSNMAIIHQFLTSQIADDDIITVMMPSYPTH